MISYLYIFVSILYCVQCCWPGIPGIPAPDERLYVNFTGLYPWELDQHMHEEPMPWYDIPQITVSNIELLLPDRLVKKFQQTQLALQREIDRAESAGWNSGCGNCWNWFHIRTEPVNRTRSHPWEEDEHMRLYMAFGMHVMPADLLWEDSLFADLEQPMFTIGK